MADLPFIQFFVADWLRDTRVLTCEAKGAWVDLICYSWTAPEPGVLCLLPEAYGRMLGLDKKKTTVVLDELASLGVCDREDLPDGRIKITCRRVVNDHFELLSTKQAQSDAGKRGAEKRWGKGGDRPPNGDPNSPPIRHPNSNSESIIQKPEGRRSERASAPPPPPISDLISGGLARMWHDAPTELDPYELTLAAAALPVLSQITEDEWDGCAAFTRADNRSRDQDKLWPRDREDFLKKPASAIAKIRKWWRKQPKAKASAPDNIVTLPPAEQERPATPDEIKEMLAVAKRQGRPA